MNLVLFWFVILNDSIWIPTHKPVFESHICAETLQPSFSLSLFSSSFCSCSPSFIVTVRRGNQAAVKLTDGISHDWRQTTRYIPHVWISFSRKKKKDRSSISVMEGDEMVKPFSLFLLFWKKILFFGCSDSCGVSKELQFISTLSVRLDIVKTCS